MSDTPRTDAWKRINDPIEDLHAFARQLERELNEANERIRLLIAERDTARRQADQNWKLREEFRELLGTDDVERGVAVVREMKERIKRLEEALDCVIIDCSFLGHKRKHRHEHNEPCPVEELIRKAKEDKP
jgi:predicted RNase H-like nuclease (RuvC/YqgF family)